MKSINTVAGTGNPVKITDLATLWDSMMMGLYGRSGDGIATILSGCEFDGAVMNIGVIFFNGEPFTLMEPALAGQYLYAQVKQEDNRTYEDGTVRPFYTNRVINVSDSGTETTLGTLIGEVNDDNASDWTWTRIANDSITNIMLTQGCVYTQNLENGAITSGKISNNAVVTSKIANFNVTDEKIANGAVTDRAIATGAVTNAKLGKWSVGTNELQEESVGTNQLIDGSVTNDILADNSISTPKLQANSIIDAKIVGQTLLNRSFSTGCVNSRVLADKAVTTAKLEDGSVTSIKMAMGSVGGDIIADKAVTGAKIADKTIMSEQLGEDAIVGGIGGVIAPDTISMYNMGVNCIGTPQLVDGAVTGLKIAQSTITANNIVSGTISKEKLMSGATARDMVLVDVSLSPTYNINKINTVYLFTGSPSTTVIQSDLNFGAANPPVGSSNIYIYKIVVPPSGQIEINLAGETIKMLTTSDNPALMVTQFFGNNDLRSKTFMVLQELDNIFL